MINGKDFLKNLLEFDPDNRLQLSLDTSISDVERKNPKAKELFCLLGLLPGGITDCDLAKIWGKGNENLVVPIEHLRNVSLLVDQTHGALRKYSLEPFYNKYAETLLKSFELKRLHERCVSFLFSILRELFNDLGAEDKGHEQERLRKLLLDYEINI